MFEQQEKKEDKGKRKRKGIEGKKKRAKRRIYQPLLPSTPPFPCLKFCGIRLLRVRQDKSNNQGKGKPLALSRVHREW